MSQEQQLDYEAAFLTLAAVDVEGLIQFYVQVLECEPVVHRSQIYAEFRLPGLRLGIFSPRIEHRSEFQGAKGGMSLCLEVTDLEGAIAHLTQLGYPPPGPIHMASHGREIYAYDPADNRLILYQRKKGS